MDTSTASMLRTAARVQARADYATWSMILAAHTLGTDEVDAQDVPPIGKELGRREVTLEIAQTLHVTENRVWAIVSDARTVRDRAPRVWIAFRDGSLNAARVSQIAATIDRLTTTASVEALDASVVGYATTHTLGELRSWLKRLRARLEPAAVQAEASRAVETRRVDISHNDDGTSWLSALLHTPVAIAVGERLRRAAKALPKIDPDTGDRDRRTRDQKQADLVGHWLTSCTGTETQIRAEIAIAIDAADLIGLTDGPGITRDDEHALPPEWVRELAASETTLFRRLVLDPVGNVLDTSALGYQPPGALRAALHWRDGTCRVAGCRAPASETDLDHELAYDRGGGTTAANLRCLCRKHHNMKSHGRLPEKYIAPPVERRERWHLPSPLVIEFDLCAG
ncbi:HNH endonuclease signature motif containing protein [Aeromicrobium duanguangcaii]|uniref:HNH endonuclease signature motif containing protein n=1 Tax=Aeromicrobium duanguangcaii TaxID=2968086 RepID=UPI002017BBCA|nr:HNH endonuclease signature motif containing protein [Aeromicrobium duanguangcaii]MCL3837097.1 HNH endonuclease [Aeromicrobium duanguangcaii]